ncbi:MAG: methionyl-tRNA formyltransferase [Holosporales bacterium]|nr:methionyl-tRNA formyltransferase [Holosporales bacterium]
MGSSSFSLEILKELQMMPVILSAVYTQPEKPAGRGQQLFKNPVHLWAEAQGLSVYAPVSLRIIEQSAFCCDALVVAAYGQLLPSCVLEASRYGGINIHASLLPRWRGAAPIQWALLAGDTQTGVTLMQMDQGLDTGAILATQSVAIEPETTAGKLLEELATAGRQVVREHLLPLADLASKARPQPENGAIYAHKITSQAARIGWEWGPVEISRHVRAFNPTPGAWFLLKGQRIKVFKVAIMPPVEQAPGVILDMWLTISCAGGAVRLLEVQPEGKKRMSGEDFLRGRPHLIGKSL